MSVLQPVRAFIALGSNLGDRVRHLHDAVDSLRVTPGLSVISVSGSFENPAVGGPAGSPSFLNAVVEVVAQLPPRALLDRLLEIEHCLGRLRREKWGPRTIDLDLVFYGDLAFRDVGLTVPHPHMHERRFVLQPLNEIAPDLRHPLLGRTVKEMLAALSE